MAKIYKLKTVDDRVGVRVPFPLLYLTTEKMIPRLRRAFATFMGFPVRAHTAIQWERLYIGYTIEGVTRENRSRAAAPLPELIPDLFREEDPWHVVVPILPLSMPYSGDAYARRQSKGDPRDLYGGTWPLYKNTNLDPNEDRPALGFLQSAKWTGYNDRPAYPITAYFVTPDEVFPSLCSACPRYAHHRAGLCSVGDTVCSDTLRDFSTPTMVSMLKGYTKYKAFMSRGKP